MSMLWEGLSTASLPKPSDQGMVFQNPHSLGFRYNSKAALPDPKPKQPGPEARPQNSELPFPKESGALLLLGSHGISGRVWP